MTIVAAAPPLGNSAGPTDSSALRAVVQLKVADAMCRALDDLGRIVDVRNPLYLAAALGLDCGGSLGGRKLRRGER